MVARVVIVLTVIACSETAMASPSLENLREMQGVSQDFERFGTSIVDSGTSDELISVTMSPERVFTSTNLGMRLFGWLMSTSFYGFCLTSTLPNMGGDGEDPVIAMSTSIATPPSTDLDITALAPWEVSVARALGVVMVSFGKQERLGRDLTTTASPRVQLALLPIGPENAAGFSVTGCFR